MDNNEDYEENEDDYKDLIKEQYEDLENLGVDLTDSFDLLTLRDIFEDMLYYVNDNYFSIINLDNIISSSSEIIRYGNTIYKFIVLDCFNQLIPVYLAKFNCINLKDFERHYRERLKGDSSNFKTHFIRIIDDKIEMFNKLIELDKSAINDKSIKEILEKYRDYIDLLNFGDTENFIENYFKQILIKYSDELPGIVLGA